MRYSFAVLSKFACAISNFQNKFLFCVLVPLARRRGVAGAFHARCVILKMSLYSLVIARECGGNRDAQSRNEKEIYFMLSNNKFLGKFWYGGCRCTKLGALLLTPFTCARAVRAAPAATLNKAGEGSRRETEAQGKQSNAKTRSIKE